MNEMLILYFVPIMAIVAIIEYIFFAVLFIRDKNYKGAIAILIILICWLPSIILIESYLLNTL